MKKTILFLFALILILSLAGCECEHSWNEATCTEPRTCSKCGETEGEPVDHDWLHATHDRPETCAKCGATQGEVLDPMIFEFTADEFAADYLYKLQFMGDVMKQDSYNYGIEQVKLNGTYMCKITYDNKEVGQLLFFDSNNKLIPYDSKDNLVNHSVMIQGLTSDSAKKVAVLSAAVWAADLSYTADYAASILSEIYNNSTHLYSDTDTDSYADIGFLYDYEIFYISRMEKKDHT